MTIFNCALTFIFALTLWSGQRDRDAKESAPAPQTRVSKKLEREILNSETQLGKAINKRDLAALDKLLAEYYADGYEGSERAAGKRTVLDECRSGTLPFYEIQSQRKLEVRAEIVEIEGLGKVRLPSGNHANKEESFRVKRLWTKKNGRWLLIAQALESLEEDEK
jgi:hypothetical protein